MKLRNLALALTTAALLPTFAYAGDNMDAISASFDRDLNHEYSVRHLPATVTDADPQKVINVALRKEHDQVLVSFVRDMYREPVAFETLPASGNSDPLDGINATLRCENSSTINASITSNLNHC
jgi:hypothetical protein